jgi:hypothetical protein
MVSRHSGRSKLMVEYFCELCRPDLHGPLKRWIRRCGRDPYVITHKPWLTVVPCSYRQRMTTYERCAHIMINPPRPNPSYSRIQHACLHHRLLPLPNQHLDLIIRKKLIHPQDQSKTVEGPDGAYHSPIVHRQKVVKAYHPSNHQSWPRGAARSVRWIQFRQIDPCRLRPTCILPLGDGLQ